MKTKFCTFASYNLLHGQEINIPAGLAVIPANNLPKDSEIKFWLDETPLQFVGNEQFESFMRNYGIGLTSEQVNV